MRLTFGCRQLGGGTRQIDAGIRRRDDDEHIAREGATGRRDDEALRLELVHLARGRGHEDVDGRAGLDLLLEVAGGAEVVTERDPGMRLREEPAELFHRFFHADRDGECQLLGGRGGAGAEQGGRGQRRDGACHEL